MTTDDERVAYLAGDLSGPIDEPDRRDLDELKGMLADPAAWAEPGADLADRVVAAVAAEAAASAGSAAPAAVPDGATPPRARWFNHRALAAVVAVAAAVVVVLAAVVSTTTEDGAPDELVVALLSTDRAPDALGRATFARTDSGWRIELDASGLPRRDDGRFYEAWLRSDDGELVSIGSFNEGEDVVLWAGVRPADFPTITITEEARDGDPASSGRVVLFGRVTGP